MVLTIVSNMCLRLSLSYAQNSKKYLIFLAVNSIIVRYDYDLKFYALILIKKHIIYDFMV